MKTHQPFMGLFVILALLAGMMAPVMDVSAGTLAGTISLTDASPYLQNFDSLAASGTSSTVPNGWDFVETGSSANATYTAGTGSSNTGDTYSFGGSGSTDRAFGGLLSGGVTPTIGASFTNNTGQVITELNVTYTGEMWRLGTSDTIVDRIDFQFSTDATSLTTGTWTNVDALDFSSPQAGGTVGAFDGNTIRTTLTSLISGLSIANGSTFYIRWTDFNATGADDGLAVDDFSLTPTLSTVVDTAPAVSSTTPANGATDVARNANITIVFNEVVTVGLDWFTISCGSSGSHTAVVSTSDAMTFVLDPEPDFAFDETCTVTVHASGVIDQDGTPDQMAADYPFGFETTSPPTLIHDVQGSGPASTMDGSSVTIEGVVTADFQATSLRGFFVQEEDSEQDTNPDTSEGIFVYNASASVNVGDRVRVTGTVDEYFGSTEISPAPVVIVLETGVQLPSTVTLNLNTASLVSTLNAADMEDFEHMLVSIPGPLWVTDNYTLGRHGNVKLSAYGVEYQYTQISPPSTAAAYNNYVAAVNERTIILDDGSSTQNPSIVPYPAPQLTALNTVRIGDSLPSGLTGVLNYRTDSGSTNPAYRIEPVGPVAFTQSLPRPAAPANVGGTLKAASSNTLNYFTTLDDPALDCNEDSEGTQCICGPTGGQACRGADSMVEFNRQQAKLAAAICGMNADILALMEIENPNPTNDPAPADGIRDYPLLALTSAVNSTCGTDYTFTDGTAAGTDAIRVAIIYKASKVTSLGFSALTAPDFVDPLSSGQAKNRPALAETFVENATGGVFTLVANHLKSKGSSCGATDPDTGDGQGNCNVTRLSAVSYMHKFWLPTDPTRSGDGDVLLVGDLNSYGMEHPITTLESVGYTDLADSSIFSYLFGGFVGTLDYALANNNLVGQVTGATVWGINGEEPAVIDYNTEFKSSEQQQNFYNADPFRSSDHSPVIVGLSLIPSDFSDLPRTAYPLAWHSASNGGVHLGANPGGGFSILGSGSNDGVKIAAGPGPDGQWTNGNTGAITVTVSGAGPGCLNAWIDWNANGSFLDRWDQIITQLAVSPGAARHSFWVPEKTFMGTGPNLVFNTRVRITDGACTTALSPYGAVARGGEVEDYRWNFSPTSISLTKLEARPNMASSALPLLGVGALALVLMGCAFILVRNRRLQER